jgi:coenzyme F420-reducing hydrogenase delta subunit
MAPHPLHRGRELARVDADLCAGCGICVGACPSSTPFRSIAELVTGIDMPNAPIGALRRSLRESLAALRAPRRIVAFGCERGADVRALAAPDVAALPLMCIGALPPSFVEYALRDGADAVIVAGCRENGCEFRLGQRWTAQRLAGAREPHLRGSVPRERLAAVWADAGEEDRLRGALEKLRAALAQQEDAHARAAIAHG